MTVLDAKIGEQIPLLTPPIEKGSMATIGSMVVRAVAMDMFHKSGTIIPEGSNSHLLNLNVPKIKKHIGRLTDGFNGTVTFFGVEKMPIDQQQLEEFNKSRQGPGEIDRENAEHLKLTAELKSSGKPHV